MADHEELLSEMELIERLPTQERLKQAKRRRAIQLKKWQDYENELNMNKIDSSSSSNRNGVRFQDHIMLLDSVMRKDYQEAQRLLELNVNPNLANEDGLTSIHQCCIDDSPELLKLLIRYGADVNVCDNDLWTPLHAAATCANLEICRILIENSAELLAVNTDGNMPYDICDDELCLEYIESEMANRGITQQAIDIKRTEVEIRMLEDIKKHKLSSHDLNKVFVEQNGATFMHISCANGYTSVLEYLLENKASINPKDNDGWTPLHVATFWGHQKVIELLIEYGADIYIKTFNDETVFDLSDDVDVREFIVQKKKEYENNDKSNSSRSLKRTSTGVSRSSSIRRSSFRDKEKCRKLDTSFKDVLIASEHKRDDLDNEEFHDKSLPNYENVNETTNTISLDVSEKELLEKLKINNKSDISTTTTKTNGNIHIQHNNKHHQSVSITYDSDNQSKTRQQQVKTTQSDSKNLNIKLNNQNKNIPNQITISDSNKIDSNNNSSSNLDLENRQAFPLKSFPPSLSSNNNNKKTLSGSSSNSITSQNTTSMSTIINNTINESNVIIVDNKSLKNSSSSSVIVDNNNNVNYKNNHHNHQQQNGVKTVTTQPKEPSVVTRNSIQNDKNKTNINNNNTSKFIPIIDTDGVKYKFKSDETIGGKSDVSNDRSTKFSCTKCLNCSIM